MQLDQGKAALTSLWRGECSHFILHLCLVSFLCGCQLIETFFFLTKFPSGRIDIRTLHDLLSHRKFWPSCKLKWFLCSILHENWSINVNQCWILLQNFLVQKRSPHCGKNNIYIRHICSTMTKLFSTFNSVIIRL